MVRFTHNLTLYPTTPIDPALANGPGKDYTWLYPGTLYILPTLVNVLCPLIPGAKTGVCNRGQKRGSGPKSSVFSYGVYISKASIRVCSSGWLGFWSRWNVENTDISEGRKGSLQFHLKHKASWGLKHRKQVKGLDIRCIKCLIDWYGSVRERYIYSVCTFYITHTDTPRAVAPAFTWLPQIFWSSDLLIPWCSNALVFWSSNLRISDPPFGWYFLFRNCLEFPISCL